MGLKSNLYGALNPYPKMDCHFYVALPGCPWSVMRVSAASLPAIKHNSTSISFLGRKLLLPSDTDRTGTWSCTYDEDLVGTGHLTLNRIDNFIKNTKMRRSEIYVFLTDEFTGEIPQNCYVLENAYIQSVDTVKLGWASTKPIQYNITFCYSGFRTWY